MTKFKVNSEFLIGGSSQIDAVFLPVRIEYNLSNEPATVNHRNSGGTSFYQRYDHDFGLQEQQKSLLRDATSALIPTNDNSNSSNWCYRASLSSTFVIVIVVLFLVFGHSYIHSLLIWMEVSGPVVSVSVLTSLFVVICFPVAWGLQLLMLTAGYLYGLLYGPLVVTASVSVGLLISTPLMRLLCSGYLRSRFYSRNVEAIVNVVSGPHGMKIIALTRLTPIPFGLQNALFSLSSISILRLLVASVGGLVPMTVLNCYMGSTLRNMQDLMSADSNSITGFFIFGGQIFMTVILSWFVIRKARVELKKTMEESDKLSSSVPNEDCSRDVCVESL